MAVAYDVRSDSFREESEIDPNGPWVRPATQLDRIEAKLDRIIGRLFSPEERGEDVG